MVVKSSIQQELHLFAEELQRQISTATLEQLAKETGFVKRASKYRGQNLVSLCVWLSQTIAIAPLTKLCSQLEASTDGYSGSSLDRPAIQQLIKDIESKAVDILVFLCLDRLTRNPKDIQFFIELVDKTNVGFISLQERFDTTSSFGIFQLHQMAAIAQLERQNITERLMRGKEQKA